MKFIIRPALLILGLLTVSSAHAVLGGDASTVNQTKSSIRGTVTKASKSNTTNSQYTYEELNANGLRIREYANLEGKVFAVTWRGIADPDLEVLFGKYFPDYRREDEKQTPSRARQKTVETSEISVRRSGMLRGKHGLAFVQELVPSSVQVGELE